jgi:hypothetical protein
VQTNLFDMSPTARAEREAQRRALLQVWARLPAAERASIQEEAIRRIQAGKPTLYHNLRRRGWEWESDADMRAEVWPYVQAVLKARAAAP